MTHRRFLALLPLVAGALLLPGRAAHAGGDEPSEPDDGPPATVVADDPFGLPDVDLIDGGEPIPDASVEVVHRWAITPVGSNDRNAVSTRSELSYTGEPGSVIEDAVTVFNLGNEVLNFRIYGTDAVNHADGTFALLPHTEESTDVGTWVTVSQENITIAPGMASTIPITVTIPDDAAPGDHVGGVVASSPTAGVTDAGSVIELDRGIGTRLYVRVAGPLEPELTIENLAVGYGTAFNTFGGSTTVTYRVHNRGNVRISGTHRATVEGPFGVGRKSGEQIEFDELLPGSSIDVTAEFDGIPALGWINADVELEARSAGGADAGDRASATSAALPVTILLVVLFLVAVAFAIRRIRRHRAGGTALVEVVPADAVEVELVDATREHQLS
jgi:hypothetical protein